MDQGYNMQPQKLKGATMLKVTGILMIIGGSASIIAAIVLLLGVAALVALGGSALLYLAAIVWLVAAVMELVAGIVGVKNNNNAEKANSCMVWGIIVAVLSVLGQVVNVIAGGDFNILSLITGLIIPVLFIIGACMNKQG